MYKYKKIFLYLLTILFIVLSTIEFIYYFKVDTTFYGLIYLIINTLILFLLIPTTYNYKKSYSTARISKLILIILIGLFNTYALEYIVIGNMSYIDSSTKYIELIHLYKNIFKGILYTLFIIFTIIESKFIIKISHKKAKNIAKK